MSDILLVVNNRAEMGPMASIIATLPEATVIGLTEMQQRNPPAQVLSFGLWWFTREFEERRPQLVVVLGDRYETLAAAQAAMFLRIPVAHIHGGETTTGAWDDSIRDSITRIAEVHFVATFAAATRVSTLSYGRLYDDIHIVGAPGLDGTTPQSADRSYKRALVTYHPETRAPDYGLANCHAMLRAIASTLLGYEIVFCGVNNDTGCDDIRRAIQDHCMKHGGRVEAALDHAAYIDLMQHAAVVVGNSSAGVIEAPWVGCPSVNIGARQSGREMAPSVLQAPAPENIQQALVEALSWNGPWAPCYKGGAAPRIAEVCREFVRDRACVDTAVVG